MGNKAFLTLTLTLTEEEVKRALDSKMPADQTVFEEYQRCVMFFEKRFVREGQVVACGALQSMAAEAAISNLLRQMDDLGKIPEAKVGRSLVLGPFSVIRTAPPSDAVKYFC